MSKIWIGALLALSGCMTPADVEPEPPAEGEAAATCDAKRAQKLVGQAATAALGTEALRLTGARRLRWIRPGDVVTMDYREDRLNIELDAQNRVTTLRCG